MQSRTLTRPDERGRIRRLRLRGRSKIVRLDDELLESAAQTSPPFTETADDLSQLAAWVTNLPLAQKDELLLRVVEEHGVTVRMELLRRFRDEHTAAIAPPPRRTVSDLLDNAARLRADRERREAAQLAEEEVRREQARVLARERRLDELAPDEDVAWVRVDTMIATRKPGEYDAAAKLLNDLQALAERDGRDDLFQRAVHGTASKAHSQTKPHRSTRPGRPLNRLDGRTCHADRFTVDEANQRLTAGTNNARVGPGL